MSTANFSFPTTTRHYTIGLDPEFTDDFEYDDAVENMKSELYRIGAVDPREKWCSRDTQCIADFSIEYFDKDYKQWDYARIHCTIESGYYQGAMFDIDLSDVEGMELSKTTKEKINRICRKIERVYAKYTLSLVRVATFSNGEAIYERASNKKSVIKAMVNGYINHNYLGA